MRMKIQTFEEFAKQFDLDDPEKCVKLLRVYEDYIDRVWGFYGKKWTFCGGCHKTVRFDQRTTKEEPVGDKIKLVTRCPVCGCPWFIKEMDEGEEKYNVER